MPIYEYVCKACGRESEIIHRISDPPERKCPHCGKNQLVKLVSAAAFRLKGGGWYETDFKSESDRKRNLVSEKDEAPAKSEASKEAKPADKSADKPAADKKPAKAPEAKPVKKPASLKKTTPKKGGK